MQWKKTVNEELKRKEVIKEKLEEIINEVCRDTEAILKEFEEEISVEEKIIEVEDKVRKEPPSRAISRRGRRRGHYAKQQ